MNPPPLQRHADRFADRNSFVLALLGVVSWAAKSNAMGAVASPPGAVSGAAQQADTGRFEASHEAPRTHADPSAPTDQALRLAAANRTTTEALLGLIQLERTAAAIILGWAEQANATQAIVRGTSTEGLLR